MIEKLEPKNPAGEDAVIKFLENGNYAGEADVNKTTSEVHEKELPTYDDVFKTLVNHCPQLLAAVVNEAHDLHYEGSEPIHFGNREHLLQSGEDIQKRMNDSSFWIVSREAAEKFHQECQSDNDTSMLPRMFEYDSQIALEDGDLVDDTLTVAFPKSAILFLRHTKSTPDMMYVKIRTGGMETLHSIKVLKLQEYSVDEIFEKSLFFFIPFHIFVYENNFLLYNEDERELEGLLTIYRDIWQRLESLLHAQRITVYTMKMLREVSRIVLNRIAKKYENVRKELGNIMGGRVIETETWRLYNSAKNEGKTEGRAEGQVEILISLIKDGFISLAEAAKRICMSEEELLKHMQ